MITYNHENFISAAIEGILKQQFPFELIISDDCSTDDTASICKRYESEHKNVQFYSNERNLGATRNFLKALSLASGKYIAFCEGDDYWTDPLKLKKQVEFLESNIDYSICFHDVEVLEDNKLKASSIKYDKDTFDIFDLARENFMHTPSVVSRKLNMVELPDYFESLHVGDYTLHMYAAKKGKIKFLPEKMAVYRIHQGGIWSTKNEIFVYEKIADYLQKLSGDNFDKKIRLILKKRLTGTYQSLLSHKKEIKYLFKIAKINPVLAGKIFIKTLVS
jgi:glycosyltransferase involved in cell wall biosynthesis